MKKENISLDILLDTDNSVASLYNVSSILVTYFINRDGTVLGSLPGATNEQTVLHIINDMG